MFKNLSIKNFRGISECDFSSFSRINFFYGKNNSGKSTALEAVFLLSGISTPVILLNENSMRSYSKISEKDLMTFFHNFNTSQEISFISEEDSGQKRRIAIKLIDKDTRTFFPKDSFMQNLGTNDAKKDYGLNYSFSVGETISKSIPMKVKPTQNGYSVSIPRINDYEEKFATVYLPPVLQFNVVLDKLSEIIKNKHKSDIISGLKILSDDVVDIAIIDNEILIDIGLKNFVPLKLMGDGMRKILSILIAIYTCKNGAVIIDEIDNGLHYSAIAPLMKLLSTVCKDYNVQLFASTHSKEILEQIFNIQNIDLNDFNFYTMFRQNKKTEIRCLPGEEAKKAYTQWNLEIR